MFGVLERERDGIGFVGVCVCVCEENFGFLCIDCRC